MLTNVSFFGKSVSRLIIGDNPFNGYSYIESVADGNTMRSFYTAEKIKETLFEMESLGYNTMLPLADPYMIRVLQEYRHMGGKMQFIFQPFMSMDQTASMRLMETVEPIGIYHQGTRTDDMFEAGNCEAIHSLVKEYRAMGIPIGLGSHRPDVIARSEKEGWDVDFYVAALQNPRITHKPEETCYVPGGPTSPFHFFKEDRPIMLNTLKGIEKPVIAYKIFAGGQMFLGKSEPEIRQGIKDVYEEVFSVLKPGDMAAIGVFQRDKDQVREDAELFCEWENR